MICKFRVTCFQWKFKKLKNPKLSIVYYVWLVPTLFKFKQKYWDPAIFYGIFLLVHLLKSHDECVWRLIQTISQMTTKQHFSFYLSSLGFISSRLPWLPCQADWFTAKYYLFLLLDFIGPNKWTRLPSTLWDFIFGFWHNYHRQINGPIFSLHSFLHHRESQYPLD